eukprot:UN27531
MGEVTAATFFAHSGIRVLSSEDIAECSNVGNEYLVTYLGQSCNEAGENFHSVQDFTFGECRNTFNETTSFTVECNFPTIRYTKYPSLDCSGAPQVYDFQNGLGGCQTIDDSKYMFLQWSGCDTEDGITHSHKMSNKLTYNSQFPTSNSFHH